MRIGELLVSRGILTPEQLQQALSAQRQFGGRLGTNLVELGYISDQSLVTALSEQLKIPCVSSTQLANVAAEVIGKIPRDLAREYRVVPFKFERRTLWVCMSDPMDLQKVDELGFRLGLSLKPNVCTELALGYALERYYGIRRESRFVALGSIGPLPAGPIVHVSNQTSGGDNEVSRAEFMSAQTARAAGDVVAAPTGAGSAPRANAGSQAFARELASVNTLGELVNTVVRFTTAFFGRGLVFTVDDGAFLGVAAAGLTDSAFDVRTLSIGVSEKSLLAQLLEEGRVMHREVVDDPIVLAMCKAAGIPPTNVTLWPVLEQRRLVLAVVAQGIDGATLKQRFVALRSFVHQASCALQIVALRHEILETSTA